MEHDTAGQEVSPIEGAERVKLLIVEDSGIQAQALTKVLRMLGFTRITASPHPDIAFEQLRSASFDLVLCDWEMPRKSGLEFLKELRSIPDFQTLPFIFLTAQADKARVIEALRSGAQDYIVKPPKIGFIREKLIPFVQAVSANSSRGHGEA